MERAEERGHHGSEHADPEHVVAPLCEQRVSALLSLGVRAQLHVEAERLARRAEGREDDAGDGEHEEETVAALGVADGRLLEAEAEAVVLVVAESLLDVPRRLLAKTHP